MEYVEVYGSVFSASRISVSVLCFELRASFFYQNKFLVSDRFDQFSNLRKKKTSRAAGSSILCY